MPGDADWANGVRGNSSAALGHGHSGGYDVAFRDENHGESGGHFELAVNENAFDPELLICGSGKSGACRRGGGHY